MSHCPRRPLSGSQVEASFRAWKFRRTSVRNSQRFQFCPLTYLPEPATEISKSPFGVTGSWHLKPRNLSRMQEGYRGCVAANQQTVRIPLLAKAGSPLRIFTGQGRPVDRPSRVLRGA
jgi:hypothetical protein